MKQFELVDTVEVGNTLGECVLWNDRQQMVWWTDIHESKLYSYQLSRSALTIYTLPERLASFGFTDDDHTLICAFASGLALYRPASGKIDWLARPEVSTPGHRFNDGRVDRQGRFWAGTMVEHAAAPAGAMPTTGSLYRLTGNKCERVLSGIKIPNSICWSPNSEKFYFADSTSHTIHTYTFDAERGIPGERQVFAELSPPVEPDGSIIDSDGCLWNAQWGGGKVVRFGTDGAIREELVLPVSQPTCVAFGGADMNLLFVSTAKLDLPGPQLSREPQAGNLFVYQTPYVGLAEARFKIQSCNI